MFFGFRYSYQLLVLFLIQLLSNKMTLNGHYFVIFFSCSVGIVYFMKELYAALLLQHNDTSNRVGAFFFTTSVLNKEVNNEHIN